MHVLWRNVSLCINRNTISISNSYFSSFGFRVDSGTEVCGVALRLFVRLITSIHLGGTDCDSVLLVEPGVGALEVSSSIIKALLHRGHCIKLNSVIP